MLQEKQSTPPTESGARNHVSPEEGNISGRLEMYRWLFWAALFVIMVLFVAQCAQLR
jgi:hypothetical protein